MKKLKNAILSNSFYQKAESWILLIVTSIIWGSSFMLMKKGLIAFSPEHVASLRLFLAGLVFLPFSYKIFKGLDRKSILFLILAAICGTGIPPFLFTHAQTVINSATAGILNSLTPLWGLVLGVLFFNYKNTLSKTSGVLLGLAGALILIFSMKGSSLTVNPYGLLIILATILYAISSLLVKSRLQHVRPIFITACTFSILLLPSAIYLFTNSPINTFVTHPLALRSFTYISILALVNTSFVNILFYRLLQRSDAIFAQSCTYLMPAVALVWGFVDGEIFEWFYFVGFALILVGVYLILRKKNK